MIIFNKIKKFLALTAIFIIAIFGTIQFVNVAQVSAAEPYLQTEKSLPSGFLDQCKKAENGSVEGCIGDILQITLTLGVMVMLARIAAAQLGVMADPNSSGKAGPIVQTRKILEEGLIGIVLLAAPVLFLSLLNSSTLNIIGFDVDSSQAGDQNGTGGGTGEDKSRSRDLVEADYTNIISRLKNSSFDLTEDSRFLTLSGELADCKTGGCIHACHFFQEAKDSTKDVRGDLNEALGLDSSFINPCKDIDSENE